jgi:putative membrane-bound dehydrogenase-like protein
MPRALCLSAVLLALAPSALASPEKPRILFLGDDGHHRPRARFAQLAPYLKKRGVTLDYTDSLADLSPKGLAAYDGLIIYANHTKISREQEKALLGFVASGKGLIALHCASYCFLNSPDYIALVGAQFRSHGTGTFRTTLGEKHPITAGYRPFSSWDETYVHTKHNTKGRTVLEYREDGGLREPWTWVRTHGKGRVFYTAWGHDERTWGEPAFQALVERGLRWAVGGHPGSVPWPISSAPPEMTKIPEGLPPFKYVDAKLPHYPGGGVGPFSKMQLPVSPEESVKHMSVPVGFEVKLWADEKLLGGKPICMTWDEKGRLWAAITADYPNNLQPRGKGNDRIVIVEDTRGAGVADKVTVFAEKLSIPTSLLRYRNGVIVHQAPETLFIEEKDGKEASRKVLFRGWHTNDTHAGPSNLRYGLDNWVHSIVGYAGFDGRVGDERHTFRQGFLRFRPDGSRLEHLRGTNNNSWGLGFSEEGLTFGSTANGNPSVYLPIPNRYYEAVRGWAPSVLGGIAGSPRMSPVTDKVRQVDHHGRFTAAAGHALYTARTYPPEYWNRTAFVCEPTGHLVSTFVLERRGAGFRSTNPWNLVASQDEWTAPIMAEVGPDGHVWILDWYNYIVQHNPTPRGFTNGKGNAYETDLRDTRHGRIYRIVYKAAKPEKAPRLSADDAEGLVAALRHPNMLWRLHAQRLLVERGRQDVVKSLTELALDRSVDESGLNVGAIHALWALHGLGALSGDGKSAEAVKAGVAALKHPSAGVRRNAALVAPPGEMGVSALLEAGLLRDDDPQVRLAALLRLAELPTHEAAGKALAALLDDEALLADEWLGDGLTAAAAAHAAPFLLAVTSREKPASAAAARVAVVARHFAASAAPEQVTKLLGALARSSPAGASVLLPGLAQGGKRDGVKLDDATEKGLAELLPRLSATGKAGLIRLMSNLGSLAIARHSAAIVQSFVDAVNNESAGLEERIAAARQAGELAGSDDATAGKLLEAVTARTPPQLAEAVLDATSGAPAFARLVLARIGELTPAVRAAALRALLGRVATTRALLAAIEDRKVSLSDLALEQKQALAAHPDRAIREQANKLLSSRGGLPSPDRAKVVERYVALVKKDGDKDKGKLVFKNHCAKCHTHSGEGAHIGPDLTGMAAHSREELVVHIFDPSRSVEGNFRVWTVTTAEGKTYSGMLASETRTSIEIIDAEARKTVIQRANIEQLSQSPKSLMPEGFEKQLKDPEVVDLLTFLTARGKYLPLVLDRVATAVSTRGMFYRHDAEAERLIFPDWKPKTFEGVPFVLVDPQGGKKPNIVLLHSPNGLCKEMPKSVTLPCNAPAKALHFLSGVSGWGYPFSRKGSVSMTVKLTYADGSTEEHPLVNGEHFADYIRRVDVPGSKFAFALREQQIRYLKVVPKKDAVLKAIELVKGADVTAPAVMAVTLEGP